MSHMDFLEILCPKFPTRFSFQSMELESVLLDEKSNLHKVCLVQTCCKCQLCNGLHPLRKWWLPSLHKMCKLGNHHLRNGCKPIQSRYLQVCRFAQGKRANLIFHPVYGSITIILYNHFPGFVHI